MCLDDENEPLLGKILLVKRANGVGPLFRLPGEVRLFGSHLTMVSSNTLDTPWENSYRTVEMEKCVQIKFS